MYLYTLKVPSARFDGGEREHQPASESTHINFHHFAGLALFLPLASSRAICARFANDRSFHPIFYCSLGDPEMQCNATPNGHILLGSERAFPIGKVTDAFLIPSAFEFASPRNPQLFLHQGRGRKNRLFSWQTRSLSSQS